MPLLTCVVLVGVVHSPSYAFLRLPTSLIANYIIMVIEKAGSMSSNSHFACHSVYLLNNACSSKSP